MVLDPVEDVYRSDHDRLWRSLLAYTCDPDLAAEAESEAFTQLLSRGDDVANPRGWVWRSAFRIAAGMLNERSESWTQADSTEQWDVSLVEFPSLLGTLSTQQREAVVLRYVGDFRPHEIAELLDTTPGTIRVQLHRAHAHLRERMDR